MVPLAHFPSNFSIVAIHAEIPCSLHLVEDFSSGTLSTVASPVCISVLGKIPVDTVNFHPAPPLPSFNDPSNPVTVVSYRMARLSLWILFPVGHLLFPRFLYSWLPSGQAALVLYFVVVSVAVP